MFDFDQQQFDCMTTTDTAVKCEKHCGMVLNASIKNNCCIGPKTKEIRPKCL